MIAQLTLITALAFGGATIAPKSGAAMCALTPADRHGFGFLKAAKPTANVNDGGASVSCVYSGKSGASVATGEGPQLKPITIAGADDAQWSDRAVSGGAAYATIAVRRRNLVFVLSIPTTADAQLQLTKLSALVLQRF